jgi:hypothetical protein
MRDILLFTLDDLGDRQGYVIAIFAIVLLAIGCVLLRDAYVWFIGLGEQALEDEEAAEQQAAVAEATGDEADVSVPATSFRAAQQQAAFGRRHREAA